MQATGVHYHHSALRQAVVKKTKDSIAIVRLHTFQLTNQNVKPLDTGVLISGLHSDDIIIRSHTFSQKKSEKLRRALILQAETQLHLKQEDLLTTAIIDDANKKATTYTTSRPTLTAHLRAYQDLGLDPERVSAIPAALQAFIHWKAPDISSYFLVDIGRDAVNCIWVENDEIKKAHALRFDLTLLSKAMMDRPLNEIDFSLVKSNQFPSFSEEARSFRRELSRVLHSFQCQRPIIFTGETLIGCSDFLLELLHDCTQEEKKITASTEELCFAIPIGLAIDYLINCKQPLQFRLPDFLSPRSWEKLGKMSAALLAMATIVAGLFLFAGTWWMNKRETEIVHNLEAWTSAKDPSLRRELFLAGSDTKDLVNQWLKLIDKNTKDYRFLMKAVTVSQFIDWLTHHPFVESISSSLSPIAFEQIHYQLVSFPRLEAQDNPYLVKIDLEFKTLSPLHARKFHDELLLQSEWIDASKEISWEMLGDRYKTSFYLKNL